MRDDVGSAARNLLTIACALLGFVQEPSSGQSTPAAKPTEVPAGVALIPQVWVDFDSGTFHTVGCKRITSSMRRMPRTVAKLQKLTPAAECAVSDAEAKRLWERELQKGLTDTTRGGGVATTSKAPASAPLSSTRVESHPSEVKEKTVSAPAAPPEPTRNEVQRRVTFTMRRESSRRNVRKIGPATRR